jgi:CheY-like chemotaxis protein
MTISRILIVDDNEKNIYLLLALLQGNGYEVVTSPHGADALDKA